MKKSLKLVLASVASATLLITGCASVSNINVSKALLNSLTMHSYESQSDITLKLFSDETKSDSQYQKNILQVFNNAKIKSHTIVQDGEHFSMDGTLVLEKGSVPFKLSATPEQFVLVLDNAKTPIVIKNKNSQNQILAIRNNIASEVVEHLPNPKNINVSNSQENINGESLSLTKIHSEMYGNEIPDLFGAFVKSLVTDKECLKAVLIQLNELNGIYSPSDKLSAEELDQNFEQYYMDLNQQAVELQSELDTFKKDTGFDNNTYLKTDIYVDNSLKARKITADLSVREPDTSKYTGSFRGFEVISTDVVTKVNESVTADEIKVTGDSLDGEKVTPKDLLSTLDSKNSVLYDVLKNDVKITNKKLIMTIDDPYLVQYH
jgi:hypothetical protein